MSTQSSLEGFDQGLRARLGAGSLAGIDEVGRGPLAGPVVAAAVLLPSKPLPELAGVRDSKELSHPKRLALYRVVRRTALAVGVGWASAAEIDGRNILNASLLAMRRALEDARLKPDFVLVDGNRDVPGLSVPQRALVRGDSLSLCVACASIIAKVLRDRWMGFLDLRHPGYGFARHKGYPTAEHIRALGQLGPSPAHRLSFSPVKAVKAGAPA